MRKGLVVCAGWMIVFSAVSAAVAEPLTLQDKSGLSVTFAETGKISNLQVGKNNLLSDRAFSGIEITDMMSGQAAKITGKIVPDGDGAVFTGESQALKVQVTARIKPTADALVMNIKITDLTGKDRAIQAKVVFVLKDLGWIWCNDLNSNYEAKVGEWNMNRATYAAPHAQSAYPFAALARPDGTGFAIGWPVTKPRFYTQHYTRTDKGVGNLVLSADLGISKDTLKFPSSADFDVILYAFDGKHQFRGALAKYYRMDPEPFSYPFDQQGLWTLWLGGGVEDIAKKMGVVYDEQEFDLGDDGGSFIRDDKWGFMSLPYTEPWGFWHALPKGFKKNIDPSVKAADFETVFKQPVMEAYIKSDLNSTEPADRFPQVTRGRVAQAILNTAVWRDPEGRWMNHYFMPDNFSWGKRKGGDTIVIIANPDPDLPHPNRWDIAWESQIGHAEQLAKKVGAKMDGVYTDSMVFGMALDRMNFRREHWKYADIPLTYTTGPDGKMVVAQAMILADVEYMMKLKEECRKRHWLSLANGWYPIYAMMAPWMDVLSAGEIGAEEKGSEKFIDQWIHGYFRVWAKNKPVNVMDYSLSLFNLASTKENVEKVIEPRINYYLIFGIYPGTANCFRKAPDTLEKLNLVLPVFQKYFPIFKAINTAGWEPLTLAAVDNKKVWIERWGVDLKKGLYFTLYNPTAVKVSPKIEINLDELKISKPASARELVSGTEVPVGVSGNKVTLSPVLGPKRCIVVKLRE